MSLEKHENCSAIGGGGWSEAESAPPLTTGSGAAGWQRRYPL